ncbi:MAG: hypothetical protein M0Q19_09915, partial [Candidatus Cloacimonetes bacterium]|nr:hypothetical protein [Candidatus Cloacimonadota bacterium]
IMKNTKQFDDHPITVRTNANTKAKTKPNICFGPNVPKNFLSLLSEAFDVPFMITAIFSLIKKYRTFYIRL